MASLDEFLEKRKISAEDLKNGGSVTDLTPMEERLNKDALVKLQK